MLQGLEDAIVPPAQAEIIVAALAKKGLPYAYLAFEGEQHGFRKAENIVRSLEAELYFYGRVFGFAPADEIEPVDDREPGLSGRARGRRAVRLIAPGAGHRQQIGGPGADFWRRVLEAGDDLFERRRVDGLPERLARRRAHLVVGVDEQRRDRLGGHAARRAG